MKWDLMWAIGGGVFLITLGQAIGGHSPSQVGYGDYLIFAGVFGGVGALIGVILGRIIRLLFSLFSKRH